MEKHKQKTSFCKWIAPVSFENLPLRLQEQIGQTNTYVKKLYFDHFLKQNLVLTFLAAHRYRGRSEGSIPLF